MASRRMVGQVDRPSKVTEPKTAYFVGDGVTLEFEIDETKEVLIQSVFIGGQRMRENVHYTKSNNNKTVTFIGGTVPDVGQDVDVEYFTEVNLGSGGITGLSEAALQNLAVQLAPYLV